MTAERRDHARLADASQQFEAMMLGEMLKPLKFGSGPDTGGDEAASGEGDTMRSFGTEAMAKSLAATGSFGLAKQIVRQVTAEHEARQSEGGGTKVL